MFLKKIITLGVYCLLQHYKLGIDIYQIRNKILINLVFLVIIYLLFFSYMLYNSDNLKIFKHVDKLPWRMNPKNDHHFGPFFH